MKTQETKHSPVHAAVVLKSALLDRAGVPHAFSTRAGGISRGIFSTLNFGNPSELTGDARDPRANIEENIRRLLDAAGCPGRTVEQVHQVHGADVRVIEPIDAAGTTSATGSADAITTRRPSQETSATADPKADAIVIRATPACALIRIADCAPVLLSSTDGSIVAAVHAGWRGIVAERDGVIGVAPAAVHAMRTLGARDLVAAIGPCIGQARFEVGPEVVAAFRAVFGPDTDRVVRTAQSGKGLIDLKEALQLQLAAAGVTETDVLPGCTYEDEAWFFSHRRERGITGRMAAVIAAK